MKLSKWFNEAPYLMVFGIIILFMCTHSPDLEYDVDPSYIIFGTNRPPAYPYFLWLFHWAGHYQYVFIMWAQGILTFLSLLYARFWLKKNLNIAEFLIFLVILFVTFTILFHFQIWFIQSEGLAFPLFILSFFTLLDCFNKFNLKKIILLAILTCLLTLTRLQFYYFYCIFFILCLGYLWQKISTKLICIAASILFGSMILTYIVDHSYHYYKHGSFAGSPYGGVLVLVQTIYLANNQAANYFNNPIEKNIVQTLINKRNEQHLNYDTDSLVELKPSLLNNAHLTYRRNYLSIQRVIEDVLDTSVENARGKKTKFEANTLAMNINKTLISHELKKNISFFIWKFVACMGGIPLFLFFLILLITLPVRLIKNNIRKPNPITTFLLVVTLITFLNAGIIATCNPNLPTYFCYSEFMLYCLAALIVSVTVPSRPNPL